ncbi:uncharacterized protein LOC141686005 [Apium graveolens]|uniref:uncharacterized protein LOC141686005 n=1 Tax=Apium graveolens TaxID=4045 RepID=UPI003D799B01
MGGAKRRDRSMSPDYRGNARSANRVNALNVRREWSPPSNYKKRVSNYTPLAASIDHIFEVKKDRGIFKKPNRLTSWQSRDKKKYCDYHESTGHDTHECRHLKDEIEELIKAGYLGEWIDKVKQSRGSDDKGKDESNRVLERNAREAQHPPLTNIHSLEDRSQKIFKTESTDITFKERESRWVHHPHNDAQVITMFIGEMNVHRVFLDNGSSENILNYSTYKKLGFLDSDMNFEDAHIYGFTGEAVWVMGSVRLPVMFEEGALSVTQMIDFKVLDQDSAHNVLIPTPNGVGSLRGSQYESRDYYHKAVKEFCRRRYEGKGLSFEDTADIQEKLSGEVHAHYFMEDPKEEETHVTETPYSMLGNVLRIRSVEEIMVNHTEGIMRKEVNGEKLEGRNEILRCLESNLKVDDPQRQDAPLESENEIEVDAPQNEDAPSTPALRKAKPCPEVNAPAYRDAPSNAGMKVENPRDFDIDLDPRIPMPTEKMGPTEDTISVSVDKDDPSKVLKHRPVSGERAIALKEEVDRLLEVGLIKESFYPEWLANPVLVKKPNGKWRTCVDFTDLNKACLKDSSPLPRMDQLVDVIAGHALLSFMDAYSSYNQIPMYGPDQEHTSFITDRGLYCYIGMPFGLINAGATCQWLVNMMFENQIGRTTEVYVDDMLVKSKEANDHVEHLIEMFNIIRRYHMKLNPLKCMFSMESGKFLGFIVNYRGIKANPAKIKALLDMKSPTSVKQVQSLTGRIAVLNRFVSKSSDRCKEFCKAIKVAGKDFVWTPEYEEAFRRIKEQQGNPLIAVVVREEDAQQSPLYYVSKRLHDAETHYTSMEKLVYSLILASRKLRPYFQAYRIEVCTAYPLRQVLHKPESSGKILKWVLDLGQFDLEYMPRTAIKGQALANFLLEFDFAVDYKALVVLHPPHTEKFLEEFPHPWWTLHVDGAVNNGEAGAGIVLVSPEGHHLMSAIHFKFYAMNNDAEYEALINGLKIALEMGVQNLIAKCDTELVVIQVNGGFQARGPQTELYLRCTQRLIRKFKEVRLECVPREKKRNADAL